MTEDAFIRGVASDTGLTREQVANWLRDLLGAVSKSTPYKGVVEYAQYNIRHRQQFDGWPRLDSLALAIRFASWFDDHYEPREEVVA